MKVLGFCSLHYGKEFLRESLISVKPFVNKMHIVYSRLPSHGFAASIPNPDSENELYNIAKEVFAENLIWEVYESFDNESAHRNLRYKHSVGYSLILTIDADEVFSGVPDALKYAYENKERWYGIKGYVNFWKSFSWYCKDDYAPIRIENLMVDNTLENLNCPMTVYHFSLCQDEETIRYKMNVFGHKNEIKGDFFDKFFNWVPEKITEITDLHPTTTGIWPQPIAFDKKTLPENLKGHDRYFKEVKNRVLLIPLDYHRHSEGDDLFGDLVVAFKPECDVMMYTNAEEALTFAPNIIHFQGSLDPYELKLLKEVTGALVTMWTGDARYVPTKSLIDYKAVVDLYMLPFSGKTLKTYETILGKPCHFIWEPIQNWRFKEPKLMEEGDVVFVGNIYEELPGGRKRVSTQKYLHKKVPELSAYGNGFVNGPINYEKVPDLYNNAYITICENNYDDLDEYFTPRNIGALATGTCALMRYFPGIEKHFENLNHCIYYHNKHELFEWISFLKNNPHTRNAIASNGYRLAIDKFTYSNWTKQYLQILKTNFKNRVC